MTVSRSTPIGADGLPPEPKGRARPPSDRAGGTHGIMSAASRPQAESPASSRPPVSGAPSWRAAWRITAPATIPLRIARFEPISSSPLAADSRSSGPARE